MLSGFQNIIHYDHSSRCIGGVALRLIFPIDISGIFISWNIIIDFYYELCLKFDEVRLDHMSCYTI